MLGGLFLTGCDYDESKDKIETQEGAEAYLKKLFPNEKFEVSEREDIVIDDGCNKSEGYSYRVKAKDK